MINQPQQQDQMQQLAQMISSANTQNAQPQMMAQQPQSAYVQSQQPQQQQQGMGGMDQLAASYGAKEAGGIGAEEAGMGAGGWWAALAAAIAINEDNARGGGYRNEDDSKYAMDLLSGNVAQQDMEQRWGPKMGDNAFGGDMIGSSQLMQGKFSEGWDTLKNKGMLGEILDIF